MTEQPSENPFSLKNLFLNSQSVHRPFSHCLFVMAMTVVVLVCTYYYGLGSEEVYAISLPWVLVLAGIALMVGVRDARQVALLAIGILAVFALCAWATSQWYGSARLGVSIVGLTLYVLLSVGMGYEQIRQSRSACCQRESKNALTDNIT